MPSETHCDSRVRMKVGDEVAFGVAFDGDRLYIPNWGAKTRVHGRLVGIERHPVRDGEHGPGVMVSDTDDFVQDSEIFDQDADDYIYELTVATTDWLPHA